MFMYDTRYSSVSHSEKTWCALTECRVHMSMLSKWVRLETCSMYHFIMLWTYLHKCMLTCIHVIPFHQKMFGACNLNVNPNFQKNAYHSSRLSRMSLCTCEELSLSLTGDVSLAVAQSCSDAILFTQFNRRYSACTNEWWRQSYRVFHLERENLRKSCGYLF